MIRRKDEIKERRVRNARGGENEVVIKAGNMNLCEDGCAHSTSNNGTEDLVMMVMSLYTLE